MDAIGVFEADAHAGKLSAEAAANNGFELEKSIDRAIFRAKERFGSYLAKSQSKQDFDERWSEVKPQVIKVIAEVTHPTPGVIRRVGAALRPESLVPASAKPARPSSAKTAASDPAVRAALAKNRPCRQVDLAAEAAADLVRVGAMQKHAWSYDQGTKLWTSRDPMQHFACPGCGTEQHIGFSKCAGCERQWNSWTVRQAGTDKTASTYMLMAREIKMRGDQFKLASDGTMTITADSDTKDDDEKALYEEQKANQGSKAGPKRPNIPQKGAAGPMMPMPGTMPGDNSGATGAPMPAAAPAGPPAGPMSGDHDQDGDVGGGITEGSPIDQIQDALEGAVMALKDVQMLSINPVLAKTASAKVATLRTAMNRFWALHKQMNYVAGELQREANEALRAADPRITSEAQFVAGFEAAARNEPLPPADRTGRAWLEGYTAFHKQAVDYHDDANIDGLFEPTGKDESTGGNDGSEYHDGAGPMIDANEIRSDAGPYDSSQPASRDFASDTDRRNNAGQSRGDQGESSSIQPKNGARGSVPKGK